MDAGVVDEIDDGLVALLVLVAEVLSQVDEQLSAHCLVAVHVGDVLKLRLTCRGQKDTISITASHTSAIIRHLVLNLQLYNVIMAQRETLKLI